MIIFKQISISVCYFTFLIRRANNVQMIIVVFLVMEEELKGFFLFSFYIFKWIF